MPEALDVQATPVAGGPRRQSPSALHVVPDGGAKLAAAEDALEEADRAVTPPRASSTEAEAAMETLNARRLQLQGEADELRRRLAAIEDEVDEVDEDLEEAEDTRDEAGPSSVRRNGRRPRPRMPSTELRD